MKYVINADERNNFRVVKTTLFNYLYYRFVLIQKTNLIRIIYLIRLFKRPKYYSIRNRGFEF